MGSASHETNAEVNSMRSTCPKFVSIQCDLFLFLFFLKSHFFIFHYFITLASSAHGPRWRLISVCFAPFLGKSGAQNNVGHCAANRQRDDEDQTSIQPHTRLQLSGPTLGCSCLLHTIALVCYAKEHTHTIESVKGLRPRAVQRALPAPCNPNSSIWTASLVQPKSPDWKLPTATLSTRPQSKCLDLLLPRLRRRPQELVVLLPLLPLLQAEELCLRDHLVGETE